MTEVNLDEGAKANEPAGDKAGGNNDQPPMDVDEAGRLKAPIDAADFVPGENDNPFANDKAQEAAGKPPNVPPETKQAESKVESKAAPVPASKAAPK